LLIRQRSSFHHLLSQLKSAQVPPPGDADRHCDFLILDAQKVILAVRDPQEARDARGLLDTSSRR
jgi:hypothetical protein